MNGPDPGATAERTAGQAGHAVGATAPPAVELTEVCKSFGAVRAVDRVSLSVGVGQFFSLLGPSGGGKSTVLRLIGGFEEPDSGRIAIAGTDTARVPPNRRPTALVFQRWALFPHMTAGDNIAFGLRARGESRKKAARRVDELLELVGLAGLGDRRPGQMSGGQQQRVALARALAIEPRVLLLDEPLSSLDLKLRAQMRAELKRVQREVGTTFVYVTHDQDEAMTMSDALAVINEGRIEQVGSPRQLYDNPASTFVATFIGNSNLLEATPDGDRPGRVRAGGVSFVPPSTLTVRHGERQLLVLRYERVQVGHRVRATNAFAARVRDVAFAGPLIRYGVALDDGDLRLFADVPYDGTQAVHAPNDPVQVGWEPDAAVPVAS